MARRSIIPRPRGRGPVEAWLAVAFTAFFVAIPRPRGRGPVEARPTAPALGPALTFRARAGAAPLKHTLTQGVPIIYFHSAPARARPR